MKLSKLFHSLYFMVMFLPLFIIPIFAININQKSVEPISIEVQEKISVDFNQYVNFKSDLSGYQSSAEFLLNGEYNFDRLSNNFTLNSTHKYYLHSENTQVGTWSTYQFYFSTNTINITITESNTRDYFFTGQSANNSFIKCKTYNSYVCNNIDVKVNLYDLTQMFGNGNEPTTKNEFEIYFNGYYPYTESQKMLVNKPSPTTYDDTDIGSQFLYSFYKPVRDYCNFSNYFGLNGVYDWFLMTFFNGTAPLVFFIFFNLMIYWLFISLLWLLFDVLIYVPMMIHRWLDKGALE